LQLEGILTFFHLVLYTTHSRLILYTNPLVATGLVQDAINAQFELQIRVSPSVVVIVGYPSCNWATFHVAIGGPCQL
jgi:hypothetical protein